MQCSHFRPPEGARVLLKGLGVERGDESLIPRGRPLLPHSRCPSQHSLASSSARPRTNPPTSVFSQGFPGTLPRNSYRCWTSWCRERGRRWRKPRIQTVAIFVAVNWLLPQALFFLHVRSVNLQCNLLQLWGFCETKTAESDKQMSWADRYRSVQL